jgi:hypothetical protein
LKNFILVFLIFTFILSTWLTLNTWSLGSTPLAWTWGLIWVLPLISAFILSQKALTLAGAFRKWDLSWTPAYTLSSVYAATQGHISEKVNNPRNLFYLFIVIAAVALAGFLIYLCTLKLLKSWKFKAFCALHPNIKK